MELIDLHAHTTASDGSLTPAELVGLAAGIGLKAVAVTDHDNVDGLPEALAKGREIGLEVVPGVEISAEYKPGTMHILGYLVDPEAAGLGPRLNELQEARRNRTPKIVAKLRELGLDITVEDIQAAAGGLQVGRPHFAKVLQDKGYAASFNEAFDKYLGKGAPAYVDKFRFSPAEAVGLIHEAGGLAVLAHPFTLRQDDPAELEEMIVGLKNDGLDGLEVYYSEHTPEMTRLYLELAARHGLLPTGGSDFHGDNKNGISLGRGRGDLAVPYELLAALKRKREERS